MSKICVISDFAFSGSGYFYLMTNLLTGLVKDGHEVTVAGLGYNGEPHNFPFSIIPAQDLQGAMAIVQNMAVVGKAEIIMVGLDIPIQISIFNELRKLGKKYIAVTPLENGPLTSSWAVHLMNMDYVFFISELGKQEALKAGLKNVDHLVVGVDTVLWHPATPEEKAQLRKGLGIEEDEFVIITVADNQERKNLWASCRAVSLLKKELPDRKIRYILVTRPDSPAGYKFPDLLVSEGINKETMIFNRGIPTKDLWGLYSASDVFLLTSKAEGLGMPVLEAMACGIPCVTTDTGALPEVLGDGRGFLVHPAYTLESDVWGNEKRDLIDTELCEAALRFVLMVYNKAEDRTMKSLEYVRARTWDKPVQQVSSVIKDLLNEKV